MHPPSYVFGNINGKTKHLSDVAGEPYHGRREFDGFLVRHVSS